MAAIHKNRKHKSALTVEKVRNYNAWSWCRRIVSSIVAALFCATRRLTDIVNFLGEYSMAGKLNIAINPKYDDANGFDEGLADVQLNGKWGFINNQGDQVIECKFDDVNPFSEGLAAFGRFAYTWGFVDKTGSIVIEQKYSEVHNFKDGVAVGFYRTPEGTRGVLLDKTGKETEFDPEFQVLSVSNGLVRVMRKSTKKEGFLDLKGNMVIEPVYNCAGGYSEGLIPVQIDSMYGFVDRTGNLVIPAVFRTADEFCNGLACVTLDNYNMTFIDKKGVPINKNGWEFCGREFGDGLCWFKDTHQGFINTKGEVEFQYIFNNCSNSFFSEGLAPVDHYDGNWGFIDKKGSKVGEETKAEQTKNFSEGLAGICQDGKWGFVSNPLK